MRQPLVAGNWKMNGSKKSVQSLVDGLKAGLKSGCNAEVVVCPPAVYISCTRDLLDGSKIVLGAQNLCDHAGQGAFTGEIAADMLLDFDCKYVIVGHSERRSLYGETDAMVAQKFKVAYEAGLKPILCVGELLEEREAGRTEDVVGRQLDAVLNMDGAVEYLADSVIAYEPVWAIGTGKTASPEQAQDVHAFIRGKISEKNSVVAAKTRILYGGSVKAGNAAELFSKPDIDGGLVGGASLVVDEFMGICRAA